MKTVGIICEYNPLHFGHVSHFGKTREVLGGDAAIVCVMSGNYVQRGDFAVFCKHARAEAAIRCGADLVVEIPSPYVLLSAEGFASAGVFILDKLGICDHISFGSESGDMDTLQEAAEALSSPEANVLLKESLGKGLPYASAQQRTADRLMGSRSDILRSPNNLLGIEYLKAIAVYKSPLLPVTVERVGGNHDGDYGYSASAMRERLLSGDEQWMLTPQAASEVFIKEIADGRGPVSMKAYELAMLSRLRAIDDFSGLTGASEGLDSRFSKYTASEPSVSRILGLLKTKRYSMSRIRRMLINACLGFSAADVQEPPPYIRVLAMNRTGMRLLRAARRKALLPIITKPASVSKISGRASDLFAKEVAATDFYVLAYQDEISRSGGHEWRKTPVIIDK